MYPTTLNMTRDECRGMLRRLELESYSNVISAFRAQGGLNEIKIKLLDDLRNVFHISQDRHRAEARRVANDEQLSTIAEAISGPNTYQEWCREGRRSFPLLPRTAPLTALSTVANGVAEVVTDENSKLPYPSETANVRSLDEVKTDVDPSKIVRDDPVVLAVEEKMNLKRSLSLADHISTILPVNKKRTISGESIQSTSQPRVHTNSRIQQFYHNHSKTQSRHKKTLSKRSIPVIPKKPILGQVKNSQSRIAKTSETSGIENKAHVPNPRTMHTYASLPPHKIISGNSVVELDPYGTHKLPQIATSKKDITNNLSKLNLSQISHQIHGQNIFMTENEVKAEKLGTPIQKFVPEDLAFTAGSFTNEISKVCTIPTIFQSGRCNIKSGPLVVGTKYHIKTKPPEGQNTQSSSILTVVDPSIATHDSANQTISLPPAPITVVNRPEDELSSTKVMSLPDNMVPSLELSSPVSDMKKIPGSPMIINSGHIQAQSITKGSIQPVVNKPKIQITSQQIINPIVGNIKLPLGMQLKSVPNRKGVKIFSSCSGKMFIQSFDSSKTIGKLGSVVTQKSIAGASVVTTTSLGSARPLTVQKVQLVPTPNSKQVSISKSNMVFMPANMLSTSGAGSAILRGIPIAKKNRTQICGEKSLDELQFTSLPRTQNNVFVIGAIPSGKSSTKEEEITLNNSNMITEDTPVDILTTPITHVENSAINNLPREGESYEVKPSLVRSISFNSKEGVRKSAINQDLQMILNPSESADIVELKLEDNINARNIEPKHDFVIGTTTDWEMELDQEANKMRGTNERTLNISRKSKDSTDNYENEIGTVLSDDNFHDVIEEETVDDEEGMISENTGETEEGMEFDVTCGSVTDEVDENVAIEYVDDTTGNSFEEEEEIYDAKEENIYETSVRDVNIHRTGSKEGREAINNNTNRLQFNRIESVSNGSFNTKKCLESPTVMYEMHQIDENGLRQSKISSRMTSGDIDISSPGASCTKKSISK